jgi:hypothetical protein
MELRVEPFSFSLDFDPHAVNTHPYLAQIIWNGEGGHLNHQNGATPDTRFDTPLERL